MQLVCMQYTPERACVNLCEWVWTASVAGHSDFLTFPPALGHCEMGQKHSSIEGQGLYTLHLHPKHERVVEFMLTPFQTLLIVCQKF